MTLTNLTYCIQCQDRISGKLGAFLYPKDNPFHATSPVFDHVRELYLWMRDNGYRTGNMHAPWAVYEVKP